MLMTSSAINKKIRNLEDEKQLLLGKEKQSCTYIQTEGYVPIIPHYDFAETETKLMEIDEQVRKLKHALNKMNSTTKLKNFDMTIDEALVYMAQLNKRKDTLDEFRQRMPAKRIKSHGYGESSNLVEYEKVNYDITAVSAKYLEIQDVVNRLQMDIDYINQTVEIEI